MKKLKTLFPILFLSVFMSCLSQEDKKAKMIDSSQLAHKKNTKAKNLTLPLKPDGEIKSLLELQDDRLQISLEKELNKNPVWKGLIANDLMSVGIVDLHDVKNIKYAGVNDRTMMYAASLPKIAILLSVMDALENKEIKDTKELRKDLKLMISKSNNAASTRNIDRIGYEKIESVLRAPQNKFYDEEVGGGLWVGKRYASGGRRYPEPMKGLSHAATTLQVCSFYYQMAMGNLINEKRSKEMLEIMKDPALHHKLVNTIEKIAPKAKIYRKSGSWKNFHSDSALVWGPNRRYIVVVLVDSDFGESIIRGLVKPVEKVMRINRNLN